MGASLWTYLLFIGGFVVEGSGFFLFLFLAYPRATHYLSVFIWQKCLRTYRKCTSFRAVQEM